MDFRKNTGKKCRKVVENINGRLFWKVIAELVPSTPSVTQLLYIYLKYVHLDMYICPSVGWNYITDYEARLILNVINQEHNNFAFGKKRFLAGEDYIVSLKDIHEFYKFIYVCYNRLLCKNEKCHDEKCGFIQINNFESVVPYCFIDNQKYVPLFYFKNERENLMHRAIKIENWSLAYLKFCWKMQGIRDELFAGNSCTVVSLDNIKRYYPPETHFEDYWPHETLNSHLPINRNSSTHLKFCYKTLGITDELFASDSCTAASLDNIKKYFPPETHFEDYCPHETLNSHLPINQNYSTYLKFCCKMLGITDELFAGDSCTAASLDNIKKYFPPETHFEDYWPHYYSHLHINQNYSIHVNRQGASIGVPLQAEPAKFTEDPVTSCGCSDEEMDLTVITASPRRRNSLWSRTKRLFRRMSCCGALIYPTNKIITRRLLAISHYR